MGRVCELNPSCLEMLLPMVWLMLMPYIMGSSNMRYLDPVVLTGADVPSFLGCADCVTRLVAFSWVKEAWSQVPVQVDERHIQDYYNIKGGECRLYKRNMESLMYTDPDTYSGADEDDTLDMDDEIVFMARFLGEKNENFIFPEGVLSANMEELEVVDPLSNSSIGFMYLFVSDGSLDQAAGNPLVEYVFNLTATTESGSNDYFDVYNFGASMSSWTDYEIKNSEDSFFKSKHYQRHFAENWNSDSVRIFSGDSSSEDLMARQEFQFGVNTCGRCVYTFKHGGTGFIVNKAGPVRAIRSWVGANSGTITQRESVMYEQREDLKTYLRVHTIHGVMDYVTYKEDLPLVFYNCHNEEGIIVDGDHKDDTFKNAFCPWEFVTGRAGSLLRTYQFDTDLGDDHGIPNDLLPERFLSSWFYDNRVPDKIDENVAIHPNGFHQCSTKLTPQKAAWGTHGMKLKDSVPEIPNTDPNRAPHEVGEEAEGCNTVAMTSSLNKLDITQNYYYLPPGLELGTAEIIYQGATNPLFIKRKNI